VTKGNYVVHVGHYKWIKRRRRARTSSVHVEAEPLSVRARLERDFGERQGMSNYDYIVWYVPTLGARAWRPLIGAVSTIKAANI